jgi:hypothetical protein
MPHLLAVRPQGNPECHRGCVPSLPKCHRGLSGHVDSPRRASSVVGRSGVDSLSSSSTVQGINASAKDAIVVATKNLDRGLAAERSQAEDVERLVADLVSTSPAVRLDLDESQLDGSWSLVYSSEFVPGNSKFYGNVPVLANSGPLRQAAKPLLPQIKNVQQVINSSSKKFDNVVTVELRPSFVDDLMAKYLGEAPVVVARLEHAYSVSGAATVSITYDKTVVKTEGGINGWFGSLPEIIIGGSRSLFGSQSLAEEIRRATEAYNSSSFDVVYLDETLRITMADRGECRIFLKSNLSL